jgi:hypothetical protein
MKRFIPRRLPYILVALATAAVTTGVSLADSGSAINACINDTNGNTRIVSTVPDDCRQHETAQTWNITGPQGVPGPPGPPGPQGERGPSNATEAYRFFTAVTVPNTGAWVEVTKIPSLDAGKYVMTGKVNVDNAFGGNGSVDCQIVAGGFFDLGITDIGAGAGQVSRATISSTFGTSIAGPTPATLSCRAYGGTGNIRAWYGEVVATQVGTLTQFAS